MSKFISRLSAPDKSNKHYYNDNIFYQCGWGMPNCTAYAWGRWYELTGTKPKVYTGNAENWYPKGKNYDGYERGMTPKLGAIACWRKGQAGNDKDGMGHVAIVEEIYSDGSILTSNSGYKASLFYTKKIAKGYALSGYAFQGFIYLPIEFDNPVSLNGYTYKDFVGDVQSAIGAKVDFIAGPETLSKTITVSASKNKYHTVVTALERYLKVLGYYSGRIESDFGENPIFGNGMTIAVKNFQKANSCVVDGEITARNKTWKKLLKLA